MVECTISKDRAQVGETVVLWPLWRLAPEATIDELEVALNNEMQQTKLAYSTRSVASQASQTVRLIRDRIEIMLPAGLPAGHYSWVIRVNGTQLQAGSLAVLVPERQFSVPPDVKLVGETLGEFAELAGYIVSDLEPGNPLTVDLYWRAKQETQTSYKSFVQVLDAQAQIVAQSDAIPATWARWTTGWLPPEVIQDTHILHIPTDLPVDCCQVIVGLYDPVTGQRALTTSGQDTISLGQPERRP